MNAKQAKVLRKQAVFLNDKSTSYSHKVMKHIKIPTGELNADGTIKLNENNEPMFTVFHRITTTLGDCTRKVYKTLKTLYKGRTCKSQ